MKITDTHCHPQFPQYDSDREEVIRRALDSGIGMICVGTDLSTSRQAIELAEKYEGLYASVGLHPNDNLEESFDRKSYIELARHPKVVAIGEIGLDYYRTEKHEYQMKRFLDQIDLSEKPVIIHCRDAHDDMIEVLKKKKLRGVIHSFNGSIEQARSYIEEGFYIGLNAIVSFDKAYVPMVKSLPLDRILLETDSPYLAPVPYRGKRNEPSYIKAVGTHVAVIRRDDEDELYEAIVHNVYELFGI